MNSTDPARADGEDGGIRRVVLIGLRASGKSTVARVLAARRGVEAVDLDDRVRAVFGGRTVPEIWATDGEPAFRAAEVRCLAAALDEGPTILALGGGTPHVPVAAAMLAAAARREIVYLRAGAERLVHRLTRDRGERPPLAAAAGAAGEDPVAAEVAWALGERDAGYRRLATIVVELDELLGGEPAVEPPDGAERVADAIEAAIASRGA